MRPLAYPHTERLAWLTDYDPHIKSETVCLPGSSIWQTSAQFSPRWRQYVYRFAGRNRLWLSSQMRSKVALSWRSLCNRCLDEGLLSAERLVCFGQHPDKTGLPRAPTAQPERWRRSKEPRRISAGRAAACLASAGTCFIDSSVRMKQHAPQSHKRQLSH